MTTRLLPAAIDMTPAGFDDLVKTAGTRLSTDARLWQSEIVAQLAAAHPYLPVEELSVEFNRIDPVKGAAVGSVKVGATGVAIPLVVSRKRSGSDPELSPTDIFYAEGRYQPLTPEAVKSAMQSREFGEPIGAAPGANGRMAGGNPYIGDLTGDTSPLEFSGQGNPAAAQMSKGAAVDPKNLPDAAKGAIMGAMAFGGHRALRELEIQNRNAERGGKKLTVGDKAKAVAKGVGTGAAVGAAVGGAGTAVAKRLGVDSPWMRSQKRAGVEAPSVRELADGTKTMTKIAASTREALCERIAKLASIHPNDLANFRALIATNPQVLQGAAATNLRMIDMLLKYKGPGSAAPGVKVTRPNVMILMRDELTGMTRVKFTGGPAEVVRSEAELKKLLGDRYAEAKDALRQHGAYVLAEDVNQVTWDVSRQQGSGARPVERDGLYAIRDRTGGTVMGHVVMQMMRPNGLNVPMRLLVSGEGRYAVAKELFGVRVGGNNRLPASKAHKGDHGVFVTYVNGTPIATTPMAIESVATLTGGPSDVRGDDFVVYNVRDPMNGEQMALVPSRAVQAFVRLREIDPTKMALTRGDIYLMPADCEWVKLTGRVEVAGAADEVVKVSSFVADAMATRVAFIDGGFRVEHADDTWQDMEDIACAELLVGMGMTKAADIVDVQNQARTARGEYVALNGLHAPELVGYSVEPETSPALPLLTTLTQAMHPSPELMKAAAASGDEQALDVVLGLNFITPQNVRLFTDSIEQFDEVASKLASLLLASRLGLQHVHEDAVKEAMEGIARTSEQLRLLQSAAQFKRQEQAPGS